MSWRRWRLGVIVSAILSLLVAGAGAVEGMKWRAFVAVFCASMLTHFGAFLKQHPIEEVKWETTPPFLPEPKSPPDTPANPT